MDYHLTKKFLPPVTIVFQKLLHSHKIRKILFLEL